MSNKYKIVASLLIISSFVVVSPAFAAVRKDANVTHQVRQGTMPDKNVQRGVAGTVSALAGNSITLSDKRGTIYTIDATNAKVYKAGVLSQVSLIQTGDSLVVMGSIASTSPTTVTATRIMDGVIKPIAPITKLKEVKDSKIGKDWKSMKTASSSPIKKPMIRRGPMIPLKSK